MTEQEALAIVVQMLNSGKVSEAETACREILAQLPGSAGAMHWLGYVCMQTGRVKEAIGLLERSYAIAPGDLTTVIDLTACQVLVGREEDAVALYQQVLALNPGALALWVNLAALLRNMARVEEAIEAGEKAWALMPGLDSTARNLAQAYTDQGRMEDALKTLEGVPRSTELDLVWARTLLLGGDWEMGMRFYEARLKLPHGYPAYLKTPMWDGKRDLAGKKVFVQTEQGLGDTIQFVRLVWDLVERTGAQVVMPVQDELWELFKDVPMEKLRVGGMLPACAEHVANLSLVGLLGIKMEEAGKRVPYLKATEDRVARWRKRIGPQGLKVGLVWAGSKKHGDDRMRSIRLQMLAPLAEVEGIRLFSLQKAEEAAQVKDAGFAIEDLGSELPDMAETAAVLECLDLLVTVDTSVAHLAGAIGTRVWMMTPWRPDWRWMLKREDSPWYPTMRLIREKRGLGWGAVINEVKERLLRFSTQP